MNKEIWLITGISSGLGQALANAAMSKGHFVIGTLRNQQEVDAFNSKHNQGGRAYLLDVTDQQALETTLKQIVDEFGRIDVLVNNAGVGFVGAIEESTTDEVRSVFEPNFFAVLNITQMVLPIMRKQKSGCIVQISSHGGLKAFAGFGIYNATKFALEGFSEAMAQEIEPFGIKTIIVEPGPFRTKFAGSALRMAHREIEDYAETAGIFRKKLKDVDGLQEGDPKKAAQAIIDVVALSKPPLRLPLGKTALLTIGSKLESVKEDIKLVEDIARSVVYNSK